MKSILNVDLYKINLDGDDKFYQDEFSYQTFGLEK